MHGLVLKTLQGLYSNTSTPNKGSTFQLGNVPWKMKDVSVFSFMDGLQTLPRTIESALRRFFPNVTIRLGVNGEVKQVRPMRADIEVPIDSVFQSYILIDPLNLGTSGQW